MRQIFKPAMHVTKPVAVRSLVRETFGFVQRARSGIGGGHFKPQAVRLDLFERIPFGGLNRKTAGAASRASRNNQMQLNKPAVIHRRSPKAGSFPVFVEDDTFDQPRFSDRVDHLLTRWCSADETARVRQRVSGDDKIRIVRFERALREQIYRFGSNVTVNR